MGRRSVPPIFTCQGDVSTNGRRCQVSVVKIKWQIVDIDGKVITAVFCRILWTFSPRDFKGFPVFSHRAKIL